MRLVRKLVRTPGRRLAVAMSTLALATGAAAQRDDTAGLFSVPRSQDDIANWRKATRDIADENYESAVERLHLLLLQRVGGVVPLPGFDRYAGLRKAVISTLRELPPAAVEAYEQLVQRQVGHVLRTPLKDLRPDDLMQLAERFPTSAAGLRARIRLGDLALEAGEAIEAQHHFRAAADAMPRDSELVPRLLQRQTAAEFLVRSAAGQRPPTEGALQGDLEDVLALGNSGTWPSYGGGYDGARGMQPAVGQMLRVLSKQISAPGFREQAVQFAMHCVGDLSGIYVNDGVRIHAINPLETDPQRAVQWTFVGPMLDASPTMFNEVKSAINRDATLACAVSPDVVIAALHVPNDVVGAAQNHGFRSIRVIRKISSRRLYAFDRTTGKLLWSHWDTRGGPIASRFTGHDAAAPPLIHGDTVYLASHDPTGAIAFYLTAYDLHTGEERWRQLICSSQQEVNMFGNSYQEFTSTGLAIQAGVVYGCSNLGVCFAANAADGEIRWVTGYDVIPLPPTQLHNQEPRPVFFANNPIVLADGVMAATPLDSAYAVGFDTATGRMLWKLHYDRVGDNNISIRWLLGAIDGEFVFSGLGIVGVKARPDTDPPGLLARPRVIARADRVEEADSWSALGIPRGAITEDGRIHFVGRDGKLRVFTARGSFDTQSPGHLRILNKGNLLLVDGIAVTIRENLLEVFADLNALVRDAERAVQADGTDPDAWWRLASLTRVRLGDNVDGAPGERLEKLMEQGLDAARERGLGSAAPVFRRLADGLFRHSLARAKRRAARDSQAGLRLFRRARERALTADQWLEAQMHVLELVEGRPSSYLAELQAMADGYGHLSLRFPGVGRVPVAAYTLWRSLPHIESPDEAVQRCQDLMDRYGDVRLGDQLARDVAAAMIKELVDRHGTAVYERLESAAAEMLRAAGDSPDQLRAVADRYPHSAAAATATARLLDIAVASGDLGAAARSFAESSRRGDPAAGVLRRMMVAAESRGNHALASALGARLMRNHADVLSDYPGDEGASYRALIAASTRPSATPALALPTRVAAKLRPANFESALTIPELTVVEGFPRPADVPIYISVDNSKLQAYSTDPLPRALGDHVFSKPLRDDSEVRLFLCGKVLLMCEPRRIRGVDHDTGLPEWSLEAKPRRSFQFLGVNDGVLHLYSSIHSTNGDGGQLIGIEPIGGAELFRHVFPLDRYSLTPIASGGFLWTLEAEGADGKPEIQRYDSITGHLTARVPLRRDVLRFLGLAGDRGAVRLRTQDTQNNLFASGDTVYLAVNSAAEDTPPKLIALGHDGRPRWRWTGTRSRIIDRAGLRDDRVVILERGMRARLIVLDRNGNEAWARELDKGARAMNWPRGQTAEVPSPLLITDRDPVARLHTYALDGGGPRFVRRLQQDDYVLNYPLVGDDFIVVPIRRKGVSRPKLTVTDLTSLGRGKLPGGSSELAVDLSPPFTMTRHGHLILIESLEGVSVLSR